MGTINQVNAREETNSRVCFWKGVQKCPPEWVTTEVTAELHKMCRDMRAMVFLCLFVLEKEWKWKISETKTMLAKAVRV